MKKQLIQILTLTMVMMSTEYVQADGPPKPLKPSTSKAITKPIGFTSPLGFKPEPPKTPYPYETKTVQQTPPPKPPKPTQYAQTSQVNLPVGKVTSAKSAEGKTINLNAQQQKPSESSVPLNSNKNNSIISEDYFNDLYEKSLHKPNEITTQEAIQINHYLKVNNLHDATVIEQPNATSSREVAPPQQSSITPPPIPSFNQYALPTRPAPAIPTQVAPVKPPKPTEQALQNILKQTPEQIDVDKAAQANAQQSYNRENTTGLNFEKQTSTASNSSIPITTKISNAVSNTISSVVSFFTPKTTLTTATPVVQKPTQTIQATPKPTFAQQMLLLKDKTHNIFAKDNQRTTKNADGTTTVKTYAKSDKNFVTALTTTTK